MKILLINLPTEHAVEDYSTPNYYLENFVKYPPLGLLCIIPGIDKHHEIKVFDLAIKNLTIDESIKKIIEYKPDILGISVMTRLLYSVYKITKTIKEKLKNTKIVIGGPHATHFTKETFELNTSDFVLPGFGEITFPALVRAIENGSKDEDLLKIPNLVFRTKNGQTIYNPLGKQLLLLDNLPFPYRKYININDYYTAASKSTMTTVYSSRGCPFRCIFCNVIEKKFYYKSAKRLVDEFEDIINHGIREIHVFDDTFNLIRQRIIDICNEIIKRKLKFSWSIRARVYPFDKEMAYLLKKSGCGRIHVGVESFDENILKYVKKNTTLEQINNFFKICREHKIETLAYLIIGFPIETKEYRQKLYKYIKNIKPEYFIINVLYPLPKTEYYQTLLDRGVYKKDYWQEFIEHPVPDFKIPYPRSVELQEELVNTAAYYTGKFYLSFNFIVKEIYRTKFNIKQFIYKSKLALFVFKDYWEKMIKKSLIYFIALKTRPSKNRTLE
jgi:radical SAM superfamily enzyme YgiQ (UPF0313 family)